eukprot:CAMPEP_0169124266 /NCGR_PEP_ID=MMETSP1015-20121227/34230_1 /TAXON_ID=342587 /ORGANISM="Karlodinium micrum, Strain CCMP2283" /LENGTH=165 /DNA_ID=CAMNT_0009187665 /DNA_START=43 /DNA_END=540 /DNA_ORIENTATION=-
MIRGAIRQILRPRVAVALGGSIGGFSLANERPSVLRCHCQVPCGIFNDDGRIASILEDAQTIRKAVAQSNELHSKGSMQDVHQMVRWIMTKEDHATKIMTTIAEYFLAQKVKKELLSEHDYLEVLALHHAVIVAAMKTKQSSEMAPVEKLEAAIAALRVVYEKPQ